MKQQQTLILKLKDGTDASVTVIADSRVEAHAFLLAEVATDILADHIEHYVTGKVMHRSGPVEVRE